MTWPRWRDTRGKTTDGGWRCLQARLFNRPRARRVTSETFQAAQPSHLPPTTSRRPQARTAQLPQSKPRLVGTMDGGSFSRLLPWGGLSPCERASENSGAS